MSRQVGTPTEFYGILGIKAVIIQSISGIPLYEKQFDKLGMASALISGFSSAISSVFDGVDETKADQKGFQMFQAKQMTITLHRLDNSILSTISDDYLPKVLLNRIEKIHMSLENALSEKIELGKKRFTDDESLLVEGIFEKNNIPLVLIENVNLETKKVEQIIEDDELRSILKYYVRLAKEFSDEKEGKCFRIDKFVNFLESKHITRNEIANLIFTLNAQNIFEICEEHHS